MQLEATGRINSRIFLKNVKCAESSALMIWHSVLICRDQFCTHYLVYRDFLFEELAYAIIAIEIHS